jgi:colanic acid/amylovoran biosynthesis glycosyltransferase
MKISTVAHFVHSYLFITGSWIYTQLSNMKKFDPFVVTRGLENLNEYPFGAIYCRRPFIGGNHLWQIALCRVIEAMTNSHKNYCISIIREMQAKLLHAHFGTEGYYYLGVQHEVDIPLVTAFYGADASRLPYDRPKWKSRYKRLFAAGALFLAEGPFMAQTLVHLGCSSDKGRVQHLGVVVQRFQFIRSNKKGREPVRILMACSFREKKGIPYGLQAFAKAIRQYSNMELRIVGGATLKEEQQLMAICKAIAQNEGIANKVFFLGYIPFEDYLKEIADAHIFLAPSIRANNGDTEGGAPISIIEAAAAGMPIIASRHCDIPNVVIDGQTGVLVPERDVNALSRAILNISCAPESWGILGTEGRKRVEKEFDVFKQVELLEDIYCEIISPTK